VKNDISSDPLATRGDCTKPIMGVPKASLRTSPTKHKKTTTTPAEKSAGTSGEGATGDVVREDRDERIVVVQFSVVGMESETRDKLFAMRNVMHRMLNAAISEWHRADKRPSKTHPTRTVLDRGPVVEAVKNILDKERAYWQAETERLPTIVAKFQNEYDREVIPNIKEEIEKKLLAEKWNLRTALCRAAITIPSSVYDQIINNTEKAFKLYKDSSFRGERSLPTFRFGQPVGWRDGRWELKGDALKKGVYDLRVPIDMIGRTTEYGTLRLIPDGPSMFKWAKQMTDEDLLQDGMVKLADARLVYSESKKQWFAKLTIRVRYKAPDASPGIAAMRRGVHNAFVIVFEDGYCRTISGGDVIAFKAKIKARKESVSRHLRSLELGTGARGHGVKRRNAALNRIDDSEARFVDTRCKTWAAHIAKLLKTRNVGTLIVAKTNSKKEFIGAVEDEKIAPFLWQWPFAKAFDCLKHACEYNGIEIKEKDCGLNRRRCPKCLHVNQEAPGLTFTCDVCQPEFKRPSDQIIGWNLLIDAVGGAPIEKSERAKQKFKRKLQELHSDS
jgi:hypothetical protein